jgi:predicted outer membrane protein
MIRRPVRWLAVALLLGVLLAGCGGSASTSTAPLAAAQAVETCKREIQAATTLTASSKSKLEAVCARAAAGDTTAVKKAVREVCEEAIKGSPLPAAAKEQALAACKSRTK